MSSPARPAPENGAKRPEAIASRGRLELLLESRPRPGRALLHALFCPVHGVARR